MGKRLLIFAIIFLSLLAFTIWRAQPPFRLQRKLLAKLPYEPENLLITDLDDDGHPEVTAIRANRTPIWVRFPFDKPSRLRFENCRAIPMWMWNCHPVLKALPVLTADNRLRLLRWKDGKVTLELLSSLPDVPISMVEVSERYAGQVFRFIQSTQYWLFLLTVKGEWQFVRKFSDDEFDFDLADLDKDGSPDVVGRRWVGEGESIGCLWWGGQKEEQFLDNYLCLSDLDGDGWIELVVERNIPELRLKIWRFDPIQKRFRVIATSEPLPNKSAIAVCLPIDLDGDGQKEILVQHIDGSCYVFQWREGKLKMWQGKNDFRYDETIHGQISLGEGLAFYSFRRCHSMWLFPPRIWLDSWKVRWKLREDVWFTVFCLLPKGKQALSPSNWRIQEAPFRLKFAGDIDGDGSDEVIGYDGRWRRWRLYCAEVTKAGELRWRDVLLGKDEPKAFAMLVDGERRGLVVSWEDGRLELLMMEGRR
jgi:hypothetical protein